MNIELVINGEVIRRTADPKQSLLRFLRDELHLVGTKEGCSTGDCGACSVLVNGKLEKACLFPLRLANGTRVQTIEGVVQKDGTLHPIQAAFLESGAVQCGFCTPGMIMATKALLYGNPSPTGAEIRKALDKNICRCTGYSMIFEAVQLAALWLANPKEFALWKPRMGGLGSSAVLFDGYKSVSGELKFVDDMRVEGQLYGQVVWSKHPYAKILNIDTIAAEKAPGVVRVFTAKDVPGLNAHGRTKPDQPVFCRDVVRYTGDIVALVVAESKDQARAAADLVKVDYEVLRGIYSALDGLREDAPQLHPKGNVCTHIVHTVGDAEAALKSAACVVQGHFESQRIEHAYLEPVAALAEPLDGGVTVYLPTQGPFETREQIAKILNIPREKVRVVVPAVGGAYGGKLEISVDGVAAVAAFLLKRPVKITMTREEDLHNTVKRHPYSMDYRVAADKDGHLLAVDAKLLADVGPYMGNSPRVIDQACMFATGPYRVPNARIEGLAIFTNNPNSGPFRGYGINQVCNAMESLMDELSIKLNMDPFELRRINMVQLGDETITGQYLESSVGAIPTLDAARRAFLEEWPELQKKARPGYRLGWGVASAYKNVGAGKGKVDDSGAAFTLLPSGRIDLRASVVDLGQAIRTEMIQLAVQSTGLDPRLFDLTTQDTARTHPHRSASAERQTVISGRAVVMAGEAFQKKILETAAEWSGIPADELEIAGDLVKTIWSQYREEETVFTLAQMGERAAKEGLSLNSEAVYVAPKTYSLKDPEERKRVPREQYRNFPTLAYATQVAIVEVEEATGKVDLLRVIAAHDVGTAINPQQIRGQIIGSIVQGQGYGLSENYPSKDGLPIFDEAAIPPCMDDCPLHMNIPQFLQLYKERRLEEAFESVILDNPLPASTGRVCDYSCQKHCRRVALDEAVNTRDVHRCIADAVFQDDEVFQRMKARVASRKLPATGSKVAIWEAGPAGLTAAFYLALLGHEVTVYDGRAEAGGALRYAISEHSLPRAVLEKEIGIIEGLGVKFVLNARLGSGISVGDIGRQHHALFVSDDTLQERLIASDNAPSSLLVMTCAGGETAPGGSSLADVMAHGKKAAVDIYERLTGQNRFELIEPHFDIDNLPPSQQPTLTVRHSVTRPAAEERARAESTLVMSAADATEEAGRCRRCDIRVSYGRLGVTTAADATSVRLEIVEDPFREGPYGAKGISEIALVPTPPAILNAIYNATGVRLYSTPADAAVIRAGMQRTAAAGGR